ncbi:hypothetical protein FRC02_008638 [Tulasnella sp. 418]|nr:hypothetical protein FRC02_008638 [Tulasnella sp. 418]
MGRLHLSSAYAIDAPRAAAATVVAPPMFVDAPFDFDAESDHPDVVYEAFLSPQQIREREDIQSVAIPLVPAEQRAASPVESVGTSDGTESVASVGDVATLSESHPLEDWLRRYGFVSTAMDLSFVPDLVRRLDVVIDEAIPAVNDALHITTDDCLGRLEAALNPGIDALLVDFREWSFAENVARLFERSWILETLGLAVQLPGLRPYRERPGAIPEATSIDHFQLGSEGGASSIVDDDEDVDVDDAASDPGLDEEDDEGPTTLPELTEPLRLVPPSPPIRPSLTPPPTDANLNLSRWWESSGDSDFRLSRPQDPQRGRVSPFIQTSRSSSVDPSIPMEEETVIAPADEPVADDDDAHSASGSSTESTVESSVESTSYTPSRVQTLPSIIHQQHRQLLPTPPHRNFFVVASH